MAKPARKTTKPKPEYLRTMATAGKTTTEIARSTALSVHAIRALMNEAGCQSNNRGSWTYPAPKRAEPKPQPARKMTLSEAFPFIKTGQVETSTGQTITMPSISMWAAAREDTRGVAR